MTSSSLANGSIDTPVLGAPTAASEKCISNFRDMEIFDSDGSSEEMFTPQGKYSRAEWTGPELPFSPISCADRPMNILDPPSGSIKWKTPEPAVSDKTLPVQFSGDHDFKLSRRTPFGSSVHNISRDSDATPKKKFMKLTPAPVPFGGAALGRTNSLQTCKVLTSSSAENAEIANINFADDFVNLGCIGRGSFAVVYRARWRKNGKVYAIKRSTQEFRGRRDRERALEETRALLLSACENVVKFERAWQENMILYSQMELCEYGSLHGIAESLKPNRVMPNASLWKVAHDVSSALFHIHSVGLVHLDIKPGNIFLCSSGALKVGDFGLASKIDTNGIDGQEGDPRYLADEVLNKSLYMACADMFSLGISLYELATGAILPPNGPEWHALRKECDITFKPPRPSTLMHIIRNIMEYDWTKRQSAGDLLAHPSVSAVGTKPDKFLMNEGKKCAVMAEAPAPVCRSSSYNHASMGTPMPATPKRPRRTSAFGL